MICHRQMDYKSHKRNIKKKQNIEQLREEAEKRRDLAYVKKYGKITEKECKTQNDFINKYFMTG